MSIRHNNLDYRFSPISVINRYNSHDCYRFLSFDYSGYSYHGTPMRALRSRSLRCNQNLHYAQKPGRKTGSKQGDSLVSPLPLHKLSKLQYVPCYDWCYDIFSKSGFLRTPGVVNRDDGIYTCAKSYYFKTWFAKDKISENATPQYAGCVFALVLGLPLYCIEAEKNVSLDIVK